MNLYYDMMAVQAPWLLCHLAVDHDLHPSELTDVAESLGRAPADIALSALEKLSKHESPLVREGTVYGLSRLSCWQARHILNEMCNDPSPEVANAAREALED